LNCREIDIFLLLEWCFVSDGECMYETSIMEYTQTLFSCSFSFSSWNRTVDAIMNGKWFAWKHDENKLELAEKVCSGTLYSKKLIKPSIAFHRYFCISRCSFSRTSSWCHRICEISPNLKQLNHKFWLKIFWKMWKKN
jgi:hypothetical protein